MANLEISRAKRLDQKVVELLPRLSRAYASKLIDDGKVLVNGQVVTKGGYKLRPEDQVKVDFDPASLDAIPEIELPVIYEDDNCVVINKPVGLLSHSKGEFNPEPTVETWLRSRTELTGQRAGIVHRLDRATSGVMICAKTPAALKLLQRQFAQRKAKKTYFAVVPAGLKLSAAEIDLPLERNPKKPATFRVGASGKTAKTTYKVVKSSDKYCLLELKPETGRTHQLRVHLSYLGCPIVGDTLYGGEPAERLMLHAAQLEITIPGSERKTFTAQLPKQLEGVLDE